MRTTITFDSDVAAAIEQVRQEDKVGVSQAVNDLVRRGLRVSGRQRPVRLKGARLDLRIDISNVNDAMEIAEGADRR